MEALFIPGALNTPADWRAALAYYGIRQDKVTGVSEWYLSRILQGHLPITQGVREKLTAALWEAILAANGKKKGPDAS